MSFLLNTKQIKNYIYRFGVIFLSGIVMTLPSSVSSFAATGSSDNQYEVEANERKSLPIQTNDINDWPKGPEISAESAILMEINTGTILYAKNIHEELPPASTTKIMTTLLALENASLDETVTFSQTAVHSLPAGASNIGMDAGQSITMEQALYGIMVGSANEVANAVGEHISGSIEGYVDLMNQRAQELGCENTHFSNTNGLPADDHYTSVYDLALIASQFFKNDLLCKIGNTPRYHFEATDTQPDDFYIKNKHQLINGEIPYEGILGGKTGYTDTARETLVTGASQNGMKLVAIVFKEESPMQFTDTVTLFDYGFNNFKAVNVASEEDRFLPRFSSFFEANDEIFGNSDSILTFNSDSYVIVPANKSLADTKTSVSYDFVSNDETAVAKINYSYNGQDIGSAYINYVGKQATYDFSDPEEAIEAGSQSSGSDMNTKKGTSTISFLNNTIYINVRRIIIYLVIGAIVLTLLHIIGSSLWRGREGFTRSDRKRYKRRKKEVKKKPHFYFTKKK